MSLIQNNSKAYLRLFKPDCLWGGVLILKMSRLCCNKDGSFTLLTGDADENDFDILVRYWVTSNDSIIREWSEQEYKECDPHDLKEMAAQIIGEYVSPDTRCYSNVQAHCIELRQMWVRNNGAKVFYYLYRLDYSKQ